MVCTVTATVDVRQWAPAPMGIAMVALGCACPRVNVNPPTLKTARVNAACVPMGTVMVAMGIVTQMASALWAILMAVETPALRGATIAPPAITMAAMALAFQMAVAFRDLL